MNRESWLSWLRLLALMGKLMFHISAEPVINMTDIFRDLPLPLQTRSGSSRPRLLPSASRIMHLECLRCKLCRLL